VTGVLPNRTKFEAAVALDAVWELQTQQIGDCETEPNSGPFEVDVAWGWQLAIPRWGTKRLTGVLPNRTKFQAVLALDEGLAWDWMVDKYLIGVLPNRTKFETVRAWVAAWAWDWPCV
jgi:hypothetical protein